MVRLSSLSLLAVFVGTALARFGAEQDVLSSTPNELLPHWSYKDCSKPGSPIHIKSIKLYPDPPVPGKDLTVTVSGKADEPIEEGAYADVTVKLGLIKLLTKEFDICKEARTAKTSIQCPVEAGEHTVKHTVALPWEIPKAKFTVDIKAYNVDDEDLLCLNLLIDFTKFPWF